jgi:hypothetical protein
VDNAPNLRSYCIRLNRYQPFHHLQSKRLHLASVMSNFIFVPVTKPSGSLSEEARRVVRSHAMQRNWTGAGARRRRKSEHQEGESIIDIGSLYTAKADNAKNKLSGLNSDKVNQLTSSCKNTSPSIDNAEVRISHSSHLKNTQTIQQDTVDSIFDALIPTLPKINFLGSLRGFSFPVGVNDSMISALHHCKQSSF